MLIATQNVHPFLKKNGLENKISIFNTCDVVCLQEVKNIKQVKKFSRRLNSKQYHYHKRKLEYGKVDYLVTFTKVDPINKGYFNIKNKGKLTGASLYTVYKKFVIYNCHFGVMGLGQKDRIETFNKIAKRHKRLYKNKPSIIVGDLNTVIPKKLGVRRFANFLVNKSKKSQLPNAESYYFNKNLLEKGFNEITTKEYTWVVPNTKIYYPYIKLDWFITKGLSCKSYKITPIIGDHHGIIGEISI